MISLILTVSMMSAKPAPQTAQFQPCVWPNKCMTAPVARFETCVYPKKCGGKKA